MPLPLPSPDLPLCARHGWFPLPPPCPRVPARWCLALALGAREEGDLRFALVSAAAGVSLSRALRTCPALSSAVLVGFLWVWRDTAGLGARLRLSENFTLELSLCKPERGRGGPRRSACGMLAVRLTFHTGPYFLALKETWWIANFLNLLPPLPPPPHKPMIYVYHISLQICVPFFYQP